MNIAPGFFESIKQLNYDDTVDNEYAAAGDNVTVPLQYIVDVDVTYSDDGNIRVASDNRTAEKLQRITIAVSRTSGKSVLSIGTYSWTAGAVIVPAYDSSANSTGASSMPTWGCF